MAALLLEEEEALKHIPHHHQQLHQLFKLQHLPKVGVVQWICVNGKHEQVKLLCLQVATQQVVVQVVKR